MTEYPDIPSMPRIQFKPSTLLAPVPIVLVSCQGLPEQANHRANLITLAWAGTINSEPPMVSISVRKSRHSHAQIRDTGEFVINLVDQAILQATDWCGVKSGRDYDKFAECKLTAIPAQGLNHAPAVAESPLNLSCRVTSIIELPSHDLFLAEIVAVQVRPDLIDRQNRLRLDRANLVAYAHGDYMSIGHQLGFFGYSVARPEVLHKRMPKTTKRTKPDTARQSSPEQPDKPKSRRQKNPRRH